jgi:DNA-binding transcriptional regulator LsrR (DeoR family)
VPVKNNKGQRLSQTEKLERMILVCEWELEHGFSRKEIALKLGYTEVHIGRIIKEAEKRGILETSRKINRQHIDQLRVDFVSRFELLDARIAPSVPDENGLRQAIGIEAARYFDEIIGQHKSVGISGGRTLHRMIERLEEKRRAIKIYPMTGLWRDLRISHIDSGALTFLLWLKCLDSTAYWFPIEPIPAETDRDQVLAHRANYMANPEVKKIYYQACKVDLALIGIAPVRRESTTIRQVKHIGIDYDFLTNEGAIGIAGGVWFNINGASVLKDDYFLSVPLDTFKEGAHKKRKKAVVIAGGEEKVLPMYVFLEKKLCNVVITDAATARALLSMKDQESIQKTQAQTV